MNNKYIHICVMCGSDYENNSASSYKCPKCEAKLNIIKKLEMLSKAENKIKRTRRTVNLENAISNIRKRVINKIDVFSSMQEVMVAIQLENQNIQYETQKEINGKKVDFFIKDMNIILEVDGELYHKDKQKEIDRDIEILKNLNKNFEIVHIDADSVPRNTWNLKEALPFIVEERNEQKLYRNSKLDTYFLEKFRAMEIFLKRSKYDN